MILFCVLREAVNVHKRGGGIQHGAEHVTEAQLVIVAEPVLLDAVGPVTAGFIAHKHIVPVTENDISGKSLHNIDILKENGKVYFIDRPLCEIVATSDRPLSSNKNDLIKRYEERYPLYCSCCDKQVAIENDPYINMQKISEDFYNENTCD